MSTFQKNSEQIIDIIDKLAKEVEKEKMKTIGARNLLRTTAKQREAQKQQIQVYIYICIPTKKWFFIKVDTNFIKDIENLNIYYFLLNEKVYFNWILYTLGLLDKLFKKCDFLEQIYVQIVQKFKTQKILIVKIFLQP